MRDILNILLRMAIEAGHRFGWIFIAERDAPRSPYADAKEVKPVRTETKRPDNVRTRLVGGGDPFAEARTVQHLEQFYNFEDGAAWDLMRYDGEKGMPDFSDWHATDDQIVKAHGYTVRTIRNYELVRPLVVLGKSNREIALETGLGIRTVESTAASVRTAFRMRIEQAVNHYPTVERGGEEEEAPQMTANLLKPL